jgi:diguanylate cyclase (GGDEF)-like protein/PAS domain S-box-containing protein
MQRAGIKGLQSDPVYAEQVRLLYENAPLAYAVTLINGAILAFIQSPLVPLAVLLTWYGSLVAVTLSRALLTWRYTRLRPRSEEARFWNIAYVVGAAAAGTVWGAAALVLFPMASIAHQVFVAFVLAGMAAGGIAVLAPRMEACVVFLAPALLPLAIRFLSQGGALQTAMGGMTLLFLVAITLSAWNFHRAIRSSLNLRFDKQELQAEIALRQRAEEQLSQEKERLQTIVRSIGEGVALIDAQGRIEYLNPAAERLFGQRSKRALHHLPKDMFVCFSEVNEPTTTAMEDSLSSAQPQRKQYVLHGDGERKYAIEELATPLFDRSGKLAGAVSVFRDVTEAQKLTERLTYAADHDLLTGLPNRNLLTFRTKQAIARAQRKHESFALLFLDLDQFKAVNDSMGHASGDALLVDVAKRLTECVREEDTIARLSGDEFVVLLDGPTQQRQVDAVANKILHTMREPFQLGVQSTIVTASIGSSLYPTDGQDAESLLGHADAAMYRAKQLGRDRSCVYTELRSARQ